MSEDTPNYSTRTPSAIEHAALWCIDNLDAQKEYPSSILQGMQAAFAIYGRESELCRSFAKLLAGLTTIVAHNERQQIESKTEACILDGLLKEQQERLTAREYLDSVVKVENDQLPDDGVPQ